jgi:hypothetical protein
MVSRKENKMNLLRTLWGWLTSLFTEAPPPAIEEQECCEEVCEIEEDCCDHEDCESEEETLPELITEDVEELPEPKPVEKAQEPEVSALAGELLRQVLLSEGVSERVIEKYSIVETFEEWYEGALDVDSVHASIQDFKAAKGGVIKSKLSKLS